MIIQNPHELPRGIVFALFPAGVCPQCCRCSPAVDGVDSAEKEGGVFWIRAVLHGLTSIQAQQTAQLLGQRFGLHAEREGVRLTRLVGSNPAEGGSIQWSSP